jgi:hypothetical protein
MSRKRSDRGVRAHTLRQLACHIRMDVSVVRTCSHGTAIPRLSWLRTLVWPVYGLSRVALLVGLPDEPPEIALLVTRSVYLAVTPSR